MVTFGSRYEQILEALRTKATELGLERDYIVAGDFRGDVIIGQRGGIAVYMHTGDDLFTDRAPLKWATVNIFCIVTGRDNEMEANIAATDLGDRVHLILESQDTRAYRFPDNPVRLDTVNTDFTASLVRFTTFYGIA